MSDFALSEAVINFAAGTEVNWNNFQLPIPANMVVYTIDTKKFKRGDGYRKYSELPAGPSIAGILSGDQSVSQMLDQLIPGDDDSIIVIENEKYIASETKLSTLISRLNVLASADATQTADLITIGAQFGMVNTNITVGDNNKLAITNSNKVAVGPTQESFINLSPIPLIAIKDVSFYSDEKCTIKEHVIYSNRTYYAVIECTHDTADVDSITFGLSDNSTLTTITAIGRGVYKVVITTSGTDATVTFTATATYNTDTTSITKIVTVGKYRTIMFNVFSGPGEDYFGKAVIDASSNIYVVGQTSSEGVGAIDAMVLKFDSNMNILARKRIGSVNNDWYGGVALDSSGNVYCVGSSYYAGVGDNNGIIVKYDSSFNVLIQKGYGGTGAEQISDIVIDSSGNVYCVGITTSDTPGLEEGFVSKFDTNLDLVAQKRYGGANHDQFNKVLLDSVGNIYAIGKTSSEGAGGWDGLVVKLDSSLNILARKRYGGTGDESFYNGAVDSSNNIYVVGETYSEGVNCDALVIKFDSNLNALVKKRYGGSGVDKFHGVAVDTQGNVICVGASTSESANTSAIVVKFDSNLNVIAKKQFGGIGYDGFGSVVINSYDTIFCLGTVGTNVDAIILRLPSNIPSGTYEIVPDLSLYLSDSFLALNDSNLTLANSTGTLNTCGLVTGTTSLSANNCLLPWTIGQVNY